MPISILAACSKEIHISAITAQRDAEHPIPLGKVPKPKTIPTMGCRGGMFAIFALI